MLIVTRRSPAPTPINCPTCLRGCNARGIGAEQHCCLALCTTPYAVAAICWCYGKDWSGYTLSRSELIPPVIMPRQDVKTPPKQGFDTLRGRPYLCPRRCLGGMRHGLVMLCGVLHLALMQFGSSSRSRRGGARGRRGRCGRGRCRGLGERDGSKQRCNESGSELLHFVLQGGRVARRRLFFASP